MAVGCCARAVRRRAPGVVARCPDASDGLPVEVTSSLRALAYGACRSETVCRDAVCRDAVRRVPGRLEQSPGTTAITARPASSTLANSQLGHHQVNQHKLRVPSVRALSQ